MPTILTIQDTVITFDANDIQAVAYAACAQIVLAGQAETKAEYEVLKSASLHWFTAAIGAENKTSASLSLLREANNAVHAALDNLVRRVY